MSEAVIRVQGLGKKFVIGQQKEQDGLLREAMTRAVRTLMRKGVDIAAGRGTAEPVRTEEFWALRDLDFEIKRGELVSIIGHNGAGKSTLLKILSRITDPTLGRVEIGGRVNSLLEVGTGFHPELSGRENVFLNGAILGMSRAEMRRRFDEIVDFSGVSKFIDTPVKRYSVGMYVRLAFAVAAHLDAEILVVDEVLAVGDAEFQARCLSRMSEAAGSGRTVLFVSHNFAAVRALTQRSIVLERGRLAFDGPVEEGLAYYSTTLGRAAKQRDWGRGTDTTLVSATLLDDEGVATEYFTPGLPLQVRIVLDTTGMPGMSIELTIRDQHNLPIGYYAAGLFGDANLPSTAGRYECTLSLDRLFLASGEYTIDLRTTGTNFVIDHQVNGALQFFVTACNPGEASYDFRQDAGLGAIALRPTAPSQMKHLAGSTMPDLDSVERLRSR